MKKRLRLGELLDNSIREQRKTEKAKEQNERKEQYKKRLEKQKIENQIQVALKNKDFAKAVYLDKQIKENFDNGKNS